MADGKGKSFLVLLLLDTLLLRGKDTCRGKERRSIDGYDRNDFLQKKGYDNERDYFVHVVLLGLNKSKLCPGKRAASGPDSCTDLGYLSTAEENKFNTAEVEFRELNTLVQCALEPIGTRRRRGENAMGLGLFDVPLGRLFDLIEGLGV